MENRLFLDVHAIQTVPPSNINRDDVGSPKTAQYGGTTRARVSSQSWKKAMRDYFKEHGDKENYGIRTLDVPKYIAEEIVKLLPEMEEEDAISLANKTLNAGGISTTKEMKTKALTFISSKQARNLAKAAINGITDKKELQDIIRNDTSIDIALFGRMLADDPILNEDASAQVAHVISTHAIEKEFDYYTATDDFLPEGSQGAGMIGTIEYNSSTFYRYANVAIHEFFNQLKDKELTAIASRLFIEAFINSMPTGKINTFGNQTLPQAVIVTLRDDRPVNMVEAFEEPIKSNDGYTKKSIQKLFENYPKYDKMVNEPLYTGFYTFDDYGVEYIGKYEETIKDLLKNTAVEIFHRL